MPTSQRLPTLDTSYFPYRLLESDFDFVETPSERKSLQRLSWTAAKHRAISPVGVSRASISIVIVVDLGEDKTIINRFVTQSAYIGVWNGEETTVERKEKKTLSHACRAFSLSRRAKSACPREKGHARFVALAFSFSHELHNTRRVGSRARFVPPCEICITVSLYDRDE